MVGTGHPTMSDGLPRELNRAHLDVQGAIENIDLIEVSREGVKPVKRFALGPG
jgi:hypothetical protein